MVIRFQNLHEKWMNGPLLEVNAEDVDEQVNFFLSLFNNIFFSRGFLHF